MILIGLDSINDIEQHQRPKESHWDLPKTQNDGFGRIQKVRYDLVIGHLWLLWDVG